MWGELASQKRSLTHHPSSQGWASRCPVLYTCLFVWAMVGWVTSPFCSFLFHKASVLCTCISMYFHIQENSYKQSVQSVWTRGLRREHGSTCRADNAENELLELPE